MKTNDEILELATRAFLRKIKPRVAECRMANLNEIDLDDSNFEIVDAMRDALNAAGAFNKN